MSHSKLSSLKLFFAGLLVLLAFSACAANVASEKAKAYAGQLFHSNSPTEGNANGDVVLVDFFDYQCRHCTELSRTLNNLIKKDTNVRVVFKDLSMLGEESEFAAKAALAAARQNKYLEFHNRLMALDTSFNDAQVLKIANQIGLDMGKFKSDMRSESVAHELAANLKLSQKLGIHGTPALVIAKNTHDSKEGKIYIELGALSEGEINDILKEVRS